MKVTVEHIGHVVHYEDEYEGGAYVPLAGGWIYTAQAMMASRPGATVCITPVTQIPQWVE